MLAMLARASDNPFRQSLGLPWERKPRERTDVITSVRCTFLHFEALIAERLIARPTDTGRRWRGQFRRRPQVPQRVSGGYRSCGRGPLSLSVTVVRGLRTAVDRADEPAGHGASTSGHDGDLLLCLRVKALIRQRKPKLRVELVVEGAGPQVRVLDQRSSPSSGDPHPDLRRREARPAGGDRGRYRGALRPDPDRRVRPHPDDDRHGDRMDRRTTRSATTPRRGSPRASRSSSSGSRSRW